jgi:hypothetical protein
MRVFQVVDDGDGDGEPDVRRVSVLPETSHGALVIRTDFSDDSAWAAIWEAVTAPSEEGFLANVDPVNEPAYRDLTAEHLTALLPENYPSVMFIADAVTVQHAEHPLIALDLRGEPGRQFRIVPAEIWGVENNVAWNMYFSEFADSVDEDGIFRGFPHP